MQKRTVAILLTRGLVDGFSGNRSLPNYKALLEINGLPMVEYVLRSLRGSKVERIFIVQSVDAKLDRFVTPDRKNHFLYYHGPEECYAESLFCGLEAVLNYYGEEVCKSLNLMLVPCDIPLATENNFNSLIELSRRQSSDVWTALIDACALKNKYPDRDFIGLYFCDLKNRYVAQNIKFINGSLLSSSPDVTKPDYLQVMWPEFRVDISKSLDKLCRQRRRKTFIFDIIVEIIQRLVLRGHWLGLLRECFKMQTGRQTTADMARILFQATGLNCGYILSQEVELSYDIDEPGHLITAANLLK